MEHASAYFHPALCSYCCAWRLQLLLGPELSSRCGPEACNTPHQMLCLSFGSLLVSAYCTLLRTQTLKNTQIGGNGMTRLIVKKCCHRILGISPDLPILCMKKCGKICFRNCSQWVCDKVPFTYPSQKAGNTSCEFNSVKHLVIERIWGLLTQASAGYWFKSPVKCCVAIMLCTFSRPCLQVRGIIFLFLSVFGF